MFPSKETSADPLPVEDKTFSKEELQNHLMPIWNKLDEMDEASPFRGSVNPKLLNKKEDNFTFVKKPMNLIRKNLEEGMYTNPREFCDDMWLMFDNAWLNNPKNSKVYKSCSKLAECFVNAINPVMCNMGYCCGQKCTFTPLPLFCYSQRKCVIKRDQEYYLYESGSTQSGVTVSDKYIYCLKCFNKLQEEGLNENLNETPNMTTKSKFIKMKNTQIEPLESCKNCKRKCHRICANFNKKVFPEGFICDTCRKEKRIPKPENKFTAKKLPHCQLSRHIEDRVNQYMIKESGLSAGQYEVVIRVLCAVDKKVEVKPMMKQKYAGFPDRFPYRSKAIFAFEVVDGAEICFFGLHVQEYGNDCPPPNRGRVYIAYLDSVHFFQPKQLRTDVYHEILLGYLEYVKKLGYTMAHIWASPPSEGDDYIFHCHPPEQQIPKPKRLQDWYEKMLKKGIKEKIVVEYKNTLQSKPVQRQSKYDAVQTPLSLPYFEGNFLPNIIEDCIRDAEKEENKRRKHEAAQAKDGDEEIYQVDDEGRAKKSNKSSNNKKKNNWKKSGGGAGDKVMDKLYTFLKNHNEAFFTVHLISDQEPAMNKPIQDPDPPVSSELMDGRDTFLNKARDEHWEFSSLRRAKYSSLCFCHALHTEKNKNMAYTCNNCNNTNACWHCTTCDDFDLCASCYNTVTHEHKFEKISTIIGVSNSKNAESANTRNKSVKRCNQYLIHACQCIDADCCRKTCHKMKKVVAHTKQCKKRQQTKCPVCKQLIMLCYYHAKHCNQQSCPVLFCSNIRQKLQEQKKSQNRRDDKLTRRRMKMLIASNGSGSVYASTSSVSAIPPSNHPHIPPTMQANSMHFGTNGNIGPNGMPNQGPMMGMNLPGTRPVNNMVDMNNPPEYSSQDKLIKQFESNLNIQHNDADEQPGAPPPRPQYTTPPIQYATPPPNQYLQPAHQKPPYQPSPHGYYSQEQHVQLYSQPAYAMSLAPPSMESQSASTKTDQVDNRRKRNFSKTSDNNTRSTRERNFAGAATELKDQFYERHKSIDPMAMVHETHGGGASIIRPNKLDIPTLIRPLPPDSPPEKRQKRQIIDENLENTNDEYLKKNSVDECLEDTQNRALHMTLDTENTNDEYLKKNSVEEYLKDTQNRALLMTLDTEPMKLVIIDVNVRWYKLVPSALSYYKENEHPQVFVTFYATERSDSGFIFMIPAHVKTNEPNGKEKNGIVICSNIWANNHDSTRQQRQDSSGSKSKSQKTPVHCLYACQSCGKKKGKGKQAIEDVVETNDDDEEMVGEEDDDEGYENEEEIISQNKSKVISNKNTTFLLKSCKEHQFQIRIAEINENLEHKSCGKKFFPELNNNLTGQKFKQQPKQPKGLPKDLVDAIYKTCIRIIRSKVKKGEDLIQNDDRLLVNGNHLGQEENESQLISIAHVKALHICRKVLANISTPTWRELLFSEKFRNDFEKKVHELELYEINNGEINKMKEISKMNNGEIKKPREQSFGQANIQFKTKALGCELFKEAILHFVNENSADIEFCVIEDVAYDITKILNFDDKKTKILTKLEAQTKLAKMHNLGFPRNMNWSHAEEVLDKCKKRKSDVTKKKKSEDILRIIDWYRQKLAEDPMISIRKLLELEYMVDGENELLENMVDEENELLENMVDGENELNIVNIGGQEEAELPTSSKATPKIYHVYYY
uniref:histone acetyltransferase n=1 Tax=Acrobeloides nanus TaxID=290746 RepID=A0A914DR75_9BILA